MCLWTNIWQFWHTIPVIMKPGLDVVSIYWEWCLLPPATSNHLCKSDESQDEAAIHRLGLGLIWTHCLWCCRPPISASKYLFSSWDRRVSLIWRHNAFLLFKVGCQQDHLKQYCKVGNKWEAMACFVLQTKDFKPKIYSKWPVEGYLCLSWKRNESPSFHEWV